MLDLLTSTYDNNNQNKHTALLLLDLKKAFDTVIHKMLINKIQHHGFRGVVKNLLDISFENWHQYVSLNNTQSSTKPINCGVPQGSVLGPLF